jgi:Fe-S cluster assembly scaffold protein SufB
VFSKKLISEPYDSLKEISTKDEDWKYTNISESINDFVVEEENNDLVENTDFDIVFNSNEFTSKDNETFNVTDLNDVSKPLIADYALRPIDRFLAQQYQKCNGGIIIDFKENNQEFITLNLQNTGLSTPYIGINVEKNVTAKLSIKFGDSLNADVYSIIEVLANSNSNLELIIDADTPKEIDIINSIFARVEKDGFFNIHTVSTGGSFSRNRIDVDLIGDGAGFNIDGVYFGEKAQVHDNRVFVNHIAKRTTSNMLTKGVRGDESRSVFTGTIHIAEGAVKTESHQENRNILLSETASAQSVPNLEILCDDVICGHGSSVGPIEENLYHYVMSRGIDKTSAEKLLIKGFFNEVISEDGWETISNKVSEEIMQKYLNVLERSK